MARRPIATADALADALRIAAAGLVIVLRQVGPSEWSTVPAEAEWSIGKDAEHVADAAMYHQWIVRRTIGQRVPSRRPVLERRRLTTPLTVDEAIALLRERSDDSVTLIRGLSPSQLALPTQPARRGDEPLGRTIDRVLVGHYDAHRQAIERKLAVLGSPSG